MPNQARIAMVDCRGAIEFICRHQDDGARPLAVLRELRDCLLREPKGIASAIPPFRREQALSRPEMLQRDLWRF